MCVANPLRALQTKVDKLTSNSQSHVKDPLPLRAGSDPAEEQSGSD